MGLDPYPSPHESTSAVGGVMKAVSVILLFLPVSLSAQARATLGPFATVDNGLPSRSVLFGVTAGTQFGPVGLRASGAAAPVSQPRASLDAASGTTRVTAWSGDADVLLSPGNLFGLPGGFIPVLFAGYGMHGALLADGGSATVPTWSYGGQLSYSVAEWLTLDTEARSRIAVNASTLPAGFHDGWEYRVGLTLHFGSTGSRRSTSPASRRYPAPPAGRDSPRPSGGSAPTTGTGASSRSASALARAVLATGDDYLGVRYTYGSSNPGDGFDCSGFVQYVFRRNGISLPRTSRLMAEVGERLPVRTSSLVPGDLIMFAGNGVRIDHVAIYAGDDRILHSSKSGGGVRYDNLNTTRGRWFLTHMVAARRVTSQSNFTAPSMFQAPANFDGYDPPDAAPQVVRKGR
jgi:cell wall-associated NlpC family hydrolase